MNGEPPYCELCVPCSGRVDKKGRLVDCGWVTDWMIEWRNGVRWKNMEKGGRRWNPPSSETLWWQERRKDFGASRANPEEPEKMQVCEKLCNLVRRVGPTRKNLTAN